MSSKKITLTKKLVKSNADKTNKDIDKTNKDIDKTNKDNDNIDEESDFIDLKLKAPINHDDNINFQIIDVLTRLVKQMTDENKSIIDKSEKTKNSFRIKSIWKAIGIIKDHNVLITSGDDAKQLKGIGQGIADRIDTILTTGTLPELADTEEPVNEETKAVNDLISVNGIGDKTALRFYRDYDIKSVADLIDKWQKGLFKIEKHKLTHHIEIGLKYYDDFKIRIPREEIDAFYPIVQKYFHEIDPNIIFEIAGSYRRKKATSGDIDILFTHKNLKTKDDIKNSKYNYLTLFTDKLLSEGLITDHMDHDFETYYKGVILLRDIPRRIDVMIIPYNTYAAALLHATGSGPFNQRLRVRAMTLGYHLSQHGLYKIVDGQKSVNPIPTKTEKEIFDILKVKMLAPEDRD